jgi:beta-galactosidase
MSVKSGFCDENNVVRSVRAPGPLREACGFYYQEFSSATSLKLKNDPFNTGEAGNSVRSWIEFLIPEKAKPLAYYDDPFFGKYPAVTENKFGKGSLIYEGCLVSDEIQSAIVAGKALEIGLMEHKNQISYPVVSRSGTNDMGKTIRYYLNYSGNDISVKYNYKGGTNLLNDKLLKKDDIISLKPWDVAIVEE